MCAGPRGGYQLARPPESISLADIIYAIDREPAVRGAPVAAPGSLAVQAVRIIWREMKAKEQRLLEELTLAEIVRRIQLTSELSYQI